LDGRRPAPWRAARKGWVHGCTRHSHSLRQIRKRHYLGRLRDQFTGLTTTLGVAAPLQALRKLLLSSDGQTKGKERWPSTSMRTICSIRTMLALTGCGLPGRWLSTAVFTVVNIAAITLLPITVTRCHHKTTTSTRCPGQFDGGLLFLPAKQAQPQAARMVSGCQSEVVAPGALT